MGDNIALNGIFDMRKAVMVFFVLLFTSVFALSVSASPADTAVSELYGGLPPDIIDKLPEGIDGDIKNGDNINAASKLGVGFIFEAIKDELAYAFADMISPIAVLFGTVILSALLGRVGSTVGEENHAVMSLAGGVSVLIGVYNVISPLWNGMSDTLSGIGALIKSSVPAVLCIQTASGELSSAAVSATWLSMTVALIEELCRVLLSPMLGICMGFMAVTAMSRFSGAPNMSGITDSFRKIFVTVLSFLTMMFTAVMSYQAVVARRGDSLALRSIKFASGNMIPVIGGALGEAADSYIASISLIKGTSGMLMMTAIILYMLPIFIRLIVCRIGLTLVSSAAGILGAQDAADTVKEACGIAELAFALVSVCSVMFTIMIGVMSQGISGV